MNTQDPTTNESVSSPRRQEHESWIAHINDLANEDGLADIYVYEDGKLTIQKQGFQHLRAYPPNRPSFDALLEVIYQGKPVPALGMDALEPSTTIGGHRFRISYCMTNTGRLIGMSYVVSTILTPKERFIPQQVVDEFNKLDSGLVVVSGEMGSGKSTLMQTLVLDWAQKKPRRIETIEDPIECIYPPLKNGSTIDQREVGVSCTDFVTGITAARRRRAKLIVVGEVRNFETAEVALRASQLGAIVLLSTHGEDAPGGVRCFLQELVQQEKWARNALASSLRMVVATKLLPNKEGKRYPIHEVLFNLKSDGAVATHIRDGNFHMLPNDIESNRRAGSPPFYMQRFADSIQERVVCDKVLPRSYLETLKDYE